jgi:hypothetical protein
MAYIWQQQPLISSSIFISSLTADNNNITTKNPVAIGANRGEMNRIIDLFLPSYFILFPHLDAPSMYS